MTDLREALKQWKCPGCGGSGKYQQDAKGRARAEARGRAPNPKFQPDAVACKVCGGDGLNPIASAAIRAAPVPQCGAEPVAWQKINEAHFHFLADNVKHGTITRGIEQTWSAHFHSRTLGRGFEIDVDAKAAVEQAYRERYATPPSRFDAESHGLRQALGKARDFLDPDRSPPRMTNREMVAVIDAALVSPPSEAGREAIAHALNEWADLGSNATQWLKNIRDGISTAEEALAEMSSNYDRVLILSRAALSRPDQGTVAVASADRGGVK